MHSTHTKHSRTPHTHRARTHARTHTTHTHTHTHTDLQDELVWAEFVSARHEVCDERSELRPLRDRLLREHAQLCKANTSTDDHKATHFTFTFSAASVTSLSEAAPVRTFLTRAGPPHKTQRASFLHGFPMTTRDVAANVTCPRDAAHMTSHDAPSRDVAHVTQLT